MTNQATSTGTQRLAARTPQFIYRPLGRTELYVSEIGFGSYRIDPETQNHHLALQQSLSQGINLIDTSANYADGGSEQLIGRVLQLLFAGGSIQRDEVVIVSKAGYLQGQNYTESQRLKTENRPWPDLVEHSPNLEHCIHPQFLADQITRSLERLQLECIDILLLHNPEYYLSWAEKEGILTDVARQTYYERIRTAFLYLEHEVEQGRIGAYGISSNTFPDQADSAQFTSLTRICAIADSIAAELGRVHHFAVIQFPMNLLEPDAAVLNNQPDGSTLIEAAIVHELGVLINRPLNAVNGSVLTRLADAPNYGQATVAEVEEGLHNMMTLEREFQQQWMPTLQHSPQITRQLGEYLTAGEMLHGRWFALGTLHQWQQTVTTYLLPRLNAARNFLAQPGNMPPDGVEWLTGYVEAVNQTFRAIGSIYGSLAQERVQQIRQRVESAEPLWLADTLSQSAVRALRSTKGIDCVLVGMRTPDYVNDMLRGLAQPVQQQSHQVAWQQLHAE